MTILKILTKISLLPLLTLATFWASIPFNFLANAQPKVDWNVSWSNGEAYAVVTSNVNGRGVYIVGYITGIGGSKDAILFKYDDKGKMQWNRTYGGLTFGEFAREVAIDNEGNIYVLGHTGSSPEDEGPIFLLKFDANGNMLWSRDEPNAFIAANKGGGVAVDKDGNIYVAGWTMAGIGTDALLLKYASNSSLIWSRTWDRAMDYGSNLIVVGSSIFVVGSSFSYTWDVFILKYDTTSMLYWNKTWDSGVDEYGKSITYQNGIYVAGYQWADTLVGTWDTLLLKFNDFGDFDWSKTWNSGKDEYCWSITHDCQSIFATGYSHINIPENSFNMIILQYDLMGNLKWSETWDSGLNDRGRGIFVDWTEIYIAGFTDGDNGLLLKYSYGEKEGEEWRTIWDSGCSDDCSSIAVNNSEVYVVGSTGLGPNPDNILLLKYLSGGSLNWTRIWDSGDYDSGNDVSVYNEYVYVAGETLGGPNPDNVLLLKYNANGNLVWNRTWDSGGHDECRALAINETTLYVVGLTWQAGQSDVFLLGYNAYSGALIFDKTWGAIDQNEGGFDVAVYHNQVYIAGFIQGGFNPSDVLLLDMLNEWSATWNSGTEDQGWGIAVDHDGKIFIAGNTGMDSSDVLLLRYFGAVWSNRTWDSGGEDQGQGIILDSKGNVYIAGTASNNVLLLKYDSHEQLLWNRTRDFGCSDRGQCIDIDDNGSLYVAGSTSTGLNPENILLVKFFSPIGKTYEFTVQDGYVFDVIIKSNSTVSDFAFSELQKQISFNVTGPTGTTAYCNITIPKYAMQGTPWTILVNNSDWTTLSTITANNTHTFIYIPYACSTNIIQIKGTYVISEFPSHIVMLVVVIATLFAVTLGVAKFSTRRKKLRIDGNLAENIQ